MPDLATQIAENLAEVRGRMADAAARSGRRADEVALVGVTKYVSAATTRTLVEAGCTLLGESRPQALCDKAESLRGLPVHWHLIGSLQRNKIRRTLPWVAMIESADSLRLLDAIDRIAGELACRARVLLEVNVSAEEAKHGFAPDELEASLAALAGFGNVEVRGLMCMARLDGTLDDARADFAALRALRDRLLRRVPEGVALDELSMGMSGDYEVAIEEGATMVRIGSALFRGCLGA